MSAAAAAPGARLGDLELIEAFEAGTLAAFPHREHVRVAWIYLGRHPLAQAARAFVDGLERFARARGVPGLYHETITWAYLLWIHECRRRTPAGTSFDEFARLHPVLFEKDGLRRFYRAGTLASAEARATFVLPDRFALDGG